jgi:hypothetical protein
MFIRAWVRPPRHLVMLFLLLTLVPSILLLAFGWRRLQQDFELERQQIDVRREEATDVLVAALEQAIAGTEAKLEDQEALRFLATTPDSISVTFEEAQLDAFPHGRLLYYPVASPGTAAPDTVFERGEALEYQHEDPRQAARWFQELARDASVAVRAGALIRAARNLRKSGEHEAALGAYSDAARLATTAIGEVPTELFARWARCDLLDHLARTAQLKSEALELRELLLEGRWRITRSVFEVHLEAASRWARAGEPPAIHRLALSDAVDRLWSEKGRREKQSDKGRGTVTAGGTQFTVLSRSTGNRTNALIAGSAFVEHEWKARLALLEKRHGVRVALNDTAPRSGVLGTTRRAAGDTGLPWTIIVHSDMASMGTR